MNRRYSCAIIVFILFHCCFSAIGQTISLVEKILLSEEPVSASIDKADNIYIAGNKGSVFKYDKNGEMLFTYSPQRPGNIKNIEAQSTLNTFLFYEGLQEFRFLNRFMTLITTQNFPSDVFARLATPSSDNNLWVFDDQDYTLKKINLNYFEADIATSLSNIVSQNFEGNHLKEYQNFVFLSDANTGIYVFDNLGNYIKLIPLESVHYFNFYEDKVYFLNNSSLVFHDLYSSEKKFIEIDSEEEYSFALVSGNYVYLVSKASLDIYFVML